MQGSVKKYITFIVNIIFDMFKEIYISNFKPFRELKIPLTKINLLIGPNNSGKTSVFEAIMLMKELFVRDHPPDAREIYVSDVSQTFFERGIKLGCTIVSKGEEIVKTFGFSSKKGICEVKIGKKIISIEYTVKRGVNRVGTFVRGIVTYNIQNEMSKTYLVDDLMEVH